MQHSIRARVTIAAFVVLGLVSAAMLALSWDSAGRAADEAFDRVIGASAISIADGMRIDDDRVVVELPQAALAMIGLQSSARVFYRVVDPAGASIAGHVTLGLDLAQATSIDPVFSTGRFRGAPVRFAVAGRYFDSGWASIIVAETKEPRSALAMKIFRPSLVAVLFVLAMSLALISFGLRWAFRPFAAIEDELRLRAPTDLGPIATPAPMEVRRLVGALDDFMRRLQGALDRVSNYASHAAHEVRTPIAAIRAQSAAALSEKSLVGARKRLKRIEANAEAAGQIINQILVDAFVQHRIGTVKASDVNLAQLVREVIDRLDPLLQPAVRLAIAPEDDARCMIQGDAVAIREAIRNLVDNALKYAPSGLIDIRIVPQGGNWQVSVSDSGPGIPEDRMGPLTERFQRGNTRGDIPGAGLGLHIVKQVANAYGGKLDLANRPEGGLSATLHFLKALCLVGLMVASLLAMPRSAQAQVRPVSELHLLTSTDHALLEQLLIGFREARPDISVMLEKVDSQLALTRIQSQTAFGTVPDLVIGHATDILTEMVNDGYGSAALAPFSAQLPSWASWRNELLTLALDQGVFVYRKAAFASLDMPRNRPDLIQLLNAPGDAFRGRVGILDVGNNAVAFLLASQEARLSTRYWRLIRAFGTAEARIYWSTADMIEAFQKGDIDVAYNATASELGPVRNDPGYAIVRADDYQLAFPRAAFMPGNARNVGAAQAFVAYVLSPAGQAIVAGTGATPILVPTQPALLRNREPSMQRISLGPGLLALRDINTRSTLMETWLQLVLTR